MLEILAQEAQRTGGSPFTILIFAAPLLLFFFLQRSNRRRVQETRSMQRSVEAGDEILTTSGMYGTVVDVDDDEDVIVVEVAPGMRIRMTMQAVSRRLTEDYDEDEEEDEEPPRADDDGPISTS